MTTTLTDRYVAAAMRSVPEKQRDDLAAELRGSIEDQIDARVDAGDAHEVAERAVLTELGDPEKLAAGYTDRPLWLIGPRYFLEWWRLLKLLLWIVPVCAAFGVAFAQVLAGASFGEIVGTVVSVTLSVIVHLAFWTTLVFAIVERSARAQQSVAASGGILGEWTPDQLPEPQPKGAGFSDLVASLVFLLVAAGAVLWDLLIGFVPSEPGLSFLDPGLWPAWISLLFVLMALEAGLAITVYAVRRWTIGLAVVNAVLNAAIAIPAIWLLFEGRLINPEYFPTLIGDEGAEVGAIVMTIAGFGIAAIAIWDSIDAFLKARRSSRP